MGFLTVLLFAHFGLTDAYLRSHVFEPPLLLPLLNAIFLGMAAIGVSWLAARSYLISGQPSLVLLGCGALTFGINGISAGWFIHLADGVNITVTIFNCGAFLSGLLHLLGSLVYFLGFPPRADRFPRLRNLAAGYGFVALIMVALPAAAAAGWTPLFFIQGFGPTLIRQFVLGTAIILFVISSVYLFSIYLKSKTPFFFWYALGLVLIAEGLLGVFLGRTVGGIIGWTGRLAQYAGGICLLAAVFGSLRERSLEEVLDELFRKPGALYASIFENSLDGILLSVYEGRILSANPSACAQLGQTPAGVRQLSIPDLFDAAQEMYPLFRLQLSTRWKARADLVMTRMSGSVFPAAVSATVFEDGQGQKLEILTFKDISERKAAEEALRESHLELNEYNYALVHNIKAPFRAVQNYANFLVEDLGDVLEGEPRQYLEGIQSAIRQAQHQFRDLEALYHMRHYTVEYAPLEMKALLDEIASVHGAASDRRLIIVEEWPEMWGETFLLRQILTELISNGLKYNQSDVKTVEVGWREAGDRRIEIFVRDNGIGIDPGYHERIFHIFTRLHTEQEYAGTGIGLAIVKRAVNKIGGTLRLESAAGNGSTFFVSLPAEIMAARRTA